MRRPAVHSLATWGFVVTVLPVLGRAPPDAVTRPDLNGTRSRSPGMAMVYLMDNDVRRAVPHTPAYEALFRDWECIVEDIDIETIRLDDPLGEATGLVRPIGQPAGFFIDGTTRRHVANPQAMDKSRFAWERVREVTAEEIRRWTEGLKLR
jgi:hypothetical protein